MRCFLLCKAKQPDLSLSFYPIDQSRFFKYKAYIVIKDSSKLPFLAWQQACIQGIWYYLVCILVLAIFRSFHLITIEQTLCTHDKPLGHFVDKPSLAQVLPNPYPYPTLTYLTLALLTHNLPFPYLTLTLLIPYSFSTLP